MRPTPDGRDLTPTGRPLGRAAAVALAVALATVAVLVAVGAIPIPDLDVLRRSARDRPAFVAAIGGAALIMLLSCVFVPGPLLMAAAGLAFGTVGGAVVAIAGLTAGACTQLLVGRRLPALRGRVRVLDRVDDIVRDGRWSAVLALRLTPGIPFTASNYALGAGSLRLPDAAFGTAVGVTPRAILYALLGSQNATANADGLAAILALLVIGTAGIAISARLVLRSRSNRRTSPRKEAPSPS